MGSLLLIRYGEIALKGKNRPFFEKKLLQNIKESLLGLEPYRVLFHRGRYYVEIAEDNLFPARRRLERVFGIVSLSPVFTAELDLEDICRQALILLKDNYEPGMTFKINTRRANKKFPGTSPEISSHVGAYLLKSGLQLKVDVHNPEVSINIEIRNEEAYLYTQSFPGSGGLPVGCNRGCYYFPEVSTAP